MQGYGAAGQNSVFGNGMNRAPAGFGCGGGGCGDFSSHGYGGGCGSGAPAFPPQPPGGGGRPAGVGGFLTAPSAPPPAAAPSPLLRIRAGIEAGNHAEVMAGVREADVAGVVLAPNVRDMIKQWLAVNSPKASEPPPEEPPAPPPPPPTEPPAGGPPPEPESKGPAVTSEKLRGALLRFFSMAAKGSDAAAGLGIIEGDDGNRYLPLPMLGRAVGLAGEEFEVAMAAYKVVTETPPGTFMMTDDARSVGLVEWVGWEEFSSSLDAIVSGTRDPAFEPRSIQGHVARAARGAVRSGPCRQPDVLKRLQENLSSEGLPEDAAPALRSAIARRARLALACLVDAIASQGLGPQAGVDSMGLVGQLPRTLFGIIFENIDDRDKGACAFLGEILQSWDRRRCFSKRWLQDAAGKFSMPKGANTERDDARGWYALTSENLHKRPSDEGKPGDVDGFLHTTSERAGIQAHSRKAETSSSSRRDAIGDSPSRKSRSPGRKSSGKASTSKQDPVEDAADAKGDDKAAKVDGAAQREKRRKILQHDEDDDETVALRLEESRKRRAALMAKYQDGAKKD
ncbi:unnamed protein product [Polarella glacialis]|uniref:Uncharacterized protein n=1 Tax=Polarella glacialis TaxID=89957 RepID=A0A813JAW9_POLGL|nr:unnamed protein product [Polarella glacialis]